MGTTAESALWRRASGAAQSRRWPLAQIGAMGNQQVSEAAFNLRAEEKADASHRQKG